MREKVFLFGWIILLLVFVVYIVWGWWQLSDKGKMRFEAKVSVVAIDEFHVSRFGLLRDISTLGVGKMVYKDQSDVMGDTVIKKIVFDLVDDMKVAKIGIRGRDGELVAGFSLVKEGGEELVRIYLSPALIGRKDERELARYVYWAILNSFDRLRLGKNGMIAENIDKLVAERTKSANFPVKINVKR